MSTDTQAPPDANAILMGGGGAPTLKLEAQGTIYGGRIVARPVARQETEFGSQTPKTYPSGDPIYGVLVDVQTDQRDPSIEGDDGIRRLYIEGKGKKDAVRNAIQTAGATGLEHGGELYMIWTGTGQPSNPGISGAKEYQARYVPAAAAALNAPAGAPGADPWAGHQTGQAPAPTNGQATQAAAAHVASTPNTPAPTGELPPGSPTHAQVAAMRAVGLDDDAILKAFPAFIPPLYPR